MTVNYLELVRDLTHAHADRLAAGETDVAVETVLIDVGRCPSCAGPLLRGAHVAYCAACGSEVDQP